MPLQKSNLALPFNSSLNLKVDPLQVQPTDLLRLVNAVWTKDKRIQKRNGYGLVTALPAGASANTLTTFNNNLTAIGSNLYSYSAGSAQWINHGRFQPVQLSVQPLYRSALSQTSADSVTGSGLTCTTFLDGDSKYKYILSDAASGTQLVGPVSLPATATNTRVFALPSYFVITFMATVGGGPHFQYVAIPVTNIANPTAATDLSTAVESITIAHDGIVANNALYVSWGGSDVSGSVKVSYLSNSLSQANVVTYTGHHPALMSTTADTSGASPVIWVSFYETAGTGLFTLAVSNTLGTLLAITAVDATKTLKQVTSTANANVVTIFSEVSNAYSYVATKTNFVTSITCTNAGALGTLTTRLRSVGLGSKAFLYNAVPYMLVAYNGTFQPSYFLMDGSGNVVAKLAYQNGGGYVAGILPSAVVSGSSVLVAYLFKDLITAVNKAQGVAATSGIYSQTGVNVASISLANTNLNTVEIGNNLHIAGGFLWMFDGTSTVEHGFHLYPEDLLTTPSITGGLMIAQQYFYVAVYEWMDAQGNIHRSAPSVPITATVASGTTGSVVVNIPYLRLTYKTSVKLTVYRWSAAQQSYYAVTSIPLPTLNDPTADSFAYLDTLADSSIIGNALVYTTGGVIENIAAPACSALALFKSRLCLIPSENPNTVWYSKQVIENTPVETSDLFTVFVAPTTGSQGSTGPSKVLTAMDDKLIIAKANAFYYMTGNGPDNTGANNDFTDAVYISSSVGCSLPHSVALEPRGILFQSDKGIWLLDRGLNTTYEGSRVEDYNTDAVVDTRVIPGTNQVRFCLASGNALVFDYFFNRWGTFSNVKAISATLYQGLHTYLTAAGTVLQETPSLYLDGGVPVLMSFTTAWMNLAGLQGFERAYMVYILGTYLSAHKLQVQIAYNYNPSPAQSVMINPTNFAGTYGSDPQYGSSSPFGGPVQLEQWRVFLSTQKCQAFQVTVNEVYDSAKGVAPGAGLTFSGLNAVVGVKKGYVPLPAAQSVG